MEQARTRLLAQAMGFEDAAAGQRVAEAIRHSSAADGRTFPFIDALGAAARRIVLALGALTCRAMGGMERRAIDWRG